jgi:hypothetical protein
MMMQKADKPAFPHSELTDEVRELTEEMAKAGVFLSAEGLQPSSKGVRLIVAKREAHLVASSFDFTPGGTSYRPINFV